MGFVEDELKHLRTTIANLDSRIRQLEQRPSALPQNGLRMILIGPPGAGSYLALHVARLSLSRTIDRITGKGTQAPRIKERFSCCHLVSQHL